MGILLLFVIYPNLILIFLSKRKQFLTDEKESQKKKIPKVSLLSEIHDFTNEKRYVDPKELVKDTVTDALNNVPTGKVGKFKVCLTFIWK